MCVHASVCVVLCTPVVLVGDKGVSFEVTVRNWGPVLEVVMQLNSWGERGGCVGGVLKTPKTNAHTHAQGQVTAYFAQPDGVSRMPFAAVRLR